MARRWEIVAVLGLIGGSTLVYYEITNRRPTANPADLHRPPILVAGVTEPDELRVEPLAPPTPNAADRALGEAFQKLGSKNATTDILNLVNPLLASYPDYADGYVLRVGALCQLSTSNHTAIISDIDAAIKYHPRAESSSVGNLLAMKAKIEYADDEDGRAMADLEAAMRGDLEKAAQMFNNGQVAPGNTSPSWCTWTESDIGGLVTKFPNDYRAYLFRGLFYTQFASNDEPSLTPALENIRKAADLNRQSALPHYFIAEAYLHGHFWKRLGSESLRATENQTVIRELDQAIDLDPKFVPALAARAELHLDGKQYAIAIPDFDRVLQINPDDSTALHDEALSKLESGDPSGAISGFTRAIERMKPGNGLANAYENRADAYINTRQYGDAVSDLTKALSYQISASIYLMNLSQFRKIYPEYASASDEAIIRKIQQTFFPQFKYEDFAKSFIDPGKAEFETFLIKDLYMKRAAAYLLEGRYHNASLDYKRAVNSFAKYADSVDRWQPIQTGSAISLFVDLKSADFSRDDAMRVWVKQAKPGADESGPYSLYQYEVNCGSRQIKTVSTASYKAGGNLAGSREGDKWESVIPDTLGETVFNGMCPAR
jgi:tetratricopeptide (TPR) repeat protein